MIDSADIAAGVALISVASKSLPASEPTSPAKLRTKELLEQLAAEYQLLRSSTDPQRNLKLTIVRDRVTSCGRKLDADDIIELINDGDYAKRIFALLIAADSSSVRIFVVVLTALEEPDTVYEQHVALVAACDLVTRLDTKLNSSHLAALRLVVDRQMKDGARHQITRAEADRWLLCQQLLAATKPNP